MRDRSADSVVGSEDSNRGSVFHGPDGMARSGVRTRLEPGAIIPNAAPHDIGEIVGGASGPSDANLTPDQIVGKDRVGASLRDLIRR